MSVWLDRLHKGAQWYDVPSKQRSAVQRLAFRTRGLITPGNIATLLGAVLVLGGLWFLFYKRAFGLGIVLLLIGRLCDLLDGFLARRTQTQSPFGEGIDAGFDKLVLLVALLVFLREDVMPLIPVVLLLIEQTATTIITLIARHKNIRMHPTRLGKYTTLSIWLMVGVYLWVYWLTWHKPVPVHDFLYTIASVIGGGVIILGAASSLRYAQIVRHSEKRRSNSLHQ